VWVFLDERRDAFYQMQDSCLHHCAKSSHIDLPIFILYCTHERSRRCRARAENLASTGWTCRARLQSKGLEFIYIPAVVDRTLEQVLLESLPTMRVKKQNLHEENVEMPLGATSEGYRNLLLGG